MADHGQDAHLDDDKIPQEGHFVGATLQIDNASPQKGEEPGVEFSGPGQAFNRDRPGSMYGRQSVKSTTSRTSMRPGIVKNEVASQTYFSYKVSPKITVQVTTYNVVDCYNLFQGSVGT